MNRAEAQAKAAIYNGLEHLEAKAQPFRGGWRVMVRRLAGGDWFPAPVMRRSAKAARNLPRSKNNGGATLPAAAPGVVALQRGGVHHP